MKKGQVYEGSVVRVDFPNKGIVCVGDETACPDRKSSSR